MPTLARFGNVRVAMYFGDHDPPHFHIEGPEISVKVEIASLRIIEGRARRSEILEALTWARAHTTLLVETWARLSEKT